MYAIIQTGGKQYRVSPGDVLRVERLPGQRGDEVKLDQVLLVTSDGGDTRVGTPLVENASVRGQILLQGKAKKVLVYKRNAARAIAANRGTGSCSPRCKFRKSWKIKGRSGRAAPADELGCAGRTQHCGG